MSSGIHAGLEIRGTASMPPATWIPIVPSIDVDELPNRTLFALLAGHPSRLQLEPLLTQRGLPSDVTRPIKEAFDSWGELAYDASWVSYEELVHVIDCMMAALEHEAHEQGFALHDLLRIHRSVSIDAVVAFLAVYHAHGFETRMVLWSTPI